MKPTTFILSCVVAVAALTLTACSTTPENSADRAPAQINVDPNISEDNVEFFSTPEDLHKHWLTWINKAQSSIVMEMFHLTDPEIIKALANKPPTVEITLILDHSELRSKASQAAEKELEANTHLKIYPSSSSFTLTHTKAMIVDDSTALVTSMNLVSTSLKGLGSAATTRDYGVVVHDPGTINEMIKVFNADIENSKNNQKETPELSQTNLLWSPVDSEEGLRSLITESLDLPSDNRFIDATVENLGEPGIEAAFANAAKAGVNVRLIVPKCVEGDGARNFLFFRDLPGVQIKVAPYPSTAEAPYMHGKMILLGNGKAYIGSINFSTSSTQSDRELGIVFTNTKAAEAIKSLFESDWQKAEAVDPNTTESQVSCENSPTHKPTKPRPHQ